MFCEKCGNEINDGEKFCSKCGTPVASINEQPVSEAGINQSVDNLKNEAAEAVNKAATATAKGAKKAASLGKDAFEKVNQKTGGFLSKIFQKKNLVPLLIGAGVLMVLVICIINGARLNNFVRKTFSSPEKYYQYVEYKQAKDLVSCGGDIYDSYMLDSVNLYDKSVATEISVELGEEGEDLLELAGLAGVDLSWLKSVQMMADASVKNQVFNIGMNAGINKDTIISGNITLDTENENIYVQIPELTKTYLGIEMKELGFNSGDDLVEIQEMSKALVEACPNRRQVEKLLNKYIKLALGCVEDVSKSTKTLKAEGIQQKATELKVTIDGDTLQKMAEAVIEEMKEDKDIEKIIADICEIYDELDADDVYDEFQDNMDDLLDEFEYYGDRNDELLTMKVYVNGKGEVIGRKLETYNMNISIIMPKKGSKFGFELIIEDDYNLAIKIQGSGKESGDKISGEFSLKYNGASLLDCTTKKLDVSELKRGRLNGTLELKLASGISNVLDYGYWDYASIIKDLQIGLNADTGKHSAKYTLDVKLDDKEVGSISLSAKTGDGSKAKIPGSNNTIFVEDEDEVEEWLEDIDWNKVMDELDKTDLPSEAIDFVEEVGEMIEDGNISSVMRILYRYF